MRESARINTLFSLIEIAGLMLVVVLAVVGGRWGSVNYLDMPHGVFGTLSASALIFFAYIGFEDLANISEEVQRPTVNVPRALLASIIITTIIYVLVGMAVVSLVEWRELAASQAPLAFAVASVLGDQGFWLMSIIALFATANTVLVGLIVGSREIYGMSRDGSLPKALARIHPRRRTPWVAVVATMVSSMAFVLFGHINLVASITDLGTFYIFIFVNASAIALRYRMPTATRVFRAPVNIGRFPLISLLGLVSSFALVSYLTVNAIVIGLGVAAVGVVVYLLLRQEIVEDS
jgi:APA family basic amino acid/polyamine antiporter